VQSVGRHEGARASRKQTLSTGKVYGASGTVSAKRTQISVGVVVVDAKIRSVHGPHYHESVGPHTESAVAEFRDQNGRPNGIQGAANNHKVVAAAVVLDKSSEHTANVGRGTVFEFAPAVI
jgi:hypothetical protein